MGTSTVGFCLFPSSALAFRTWLDTEVKILKGGIGMWLRALWATVAENIHSLGGDEPGVVFNITGKSRVNEVREVTGRDSVTSEKC